jgi:hypothetical protein
MMIGGEVSREGRAAFEQRLETRRIRFCSHRTPSPHPADAFQLKKAGTVLVIQSVARVASRRLVLDVENDAIRLSRLQN